jgi:enoyl-CoA hydratase
LLSATEALTAGLVAEVVDRDRLDAHVSELLARICSNAPLTLSALKEVERRVLRDGLDAEADDVLATVYGSRDFQAGVAAFLNHDRFEWEGR